jgi:hypothetical protein
MEGLGVISRIEEPTDWCAGMVVVPKADGGVRICVDLTKLNRYVKRERHILPSVEHVLAQVGDAKVFSKLDANSGFWQIELTPESAKLTTFITPFGRYIFNRLPFGISSAPELFQHRISEILRDYDGVVGLIDDVLIHGKTEEEHQQRLTAVLDKLKEEGITLNKDKCKFFTDQIQFLGQVISREGVSADIKKVEAIQNLPIPTNVSEVRRFLGMLNQLSKFSPNLSEKSKPLRDLLSKKNQWMWGQSQDEAFKALKEELSSGRTLALYEPNRESKVSADASAYGLGAVLRQKQPDQSWKPIAYISRSMTPTEQRYAQIEKEALAMTWACEKFSQYLLGSKFQIETDHKPLVPLMSIKNLEELPLRIQRFRLRMMRYHYDVQHVPGKDLNTADLLSRSPLSDTGEEDDLQEEVKLYVDHIFKYLPASDRRLDQIKEHQKNDPVLSKWKSQVMGERGRSKSSMCHNDLSVKDGLLMKDSRIVIPENLRQEIMQQIHSGHQGLVKCKERARQSVWWPGITKDIEEFIRKCRVCCQFQKPQFQPLLGTTLPDTPWQKVGTDLFEWKQVNYILIVDYYSRFIEIAKLSSTTSESIINHMKSIFARHGIPREVISDNGPQYSSMMFKKFAEDYGFNHVTSSPRYPQANGEAERAVQTIKDLLKRSKDPYMALLAYRATPLKLGYSPAELLMGRTLRTTIPITTKSLKPKLLSSKIVRKRDRKQKETQKKYYDQRHRASERTALEPGDEVWIPDQEVTGEIEEELGSRSYLIRTPTGVLRRNQRDVNRLPNQEEYSEDTNEIGTSLNVTTNTENSHSSQGPRRSSRQSKPPDRYGIWLNHVTQT